MMKSISEIIAINDQALKANKVVQDGLKREALTASAEDEERIVAKIARARVQFTKLALIGVRLRAANIEVLELPEPENRRLEELAAAIDDQILRDARVNFSISLATDLLNQTGEIFRLLSAATPATT